MNEWWRTKEFPDRYSLDEERTYRFYRIVPQPGNDNYAVPAYSGKNTVTVKPRAVRTRSVQGDLRVTPVSLFRTPWQCIAAEHGWMDVEALKHSPEDLDFVGPVVHRWLLYGTNQDPKFILPEPSALFAKAAGLNPVLALEPVEMRYVAQIGGEYRDGRRDSYAIWLWGKEGWE